MHLPTLALLTTATLSLLNPVSGQQASILSSKLAEIDACFAIGDCVDCPDENADDPACASTDRWQQLDCMHIEEDGEEDATSFTKTSYTMYSSCSYTATDLYWSTVRFQLFALVLGGGSLYKAAKLGRGNVNEFDRRKRDGYTPEKGLPVRSKTSEDDAANGEETVSFLNQRSSMMGDGDIELV